MDRKEVRKRVKKDWKRIERRCRVEMHQKEVTKWKWNGKQRVEKEHDFSTKDAHHQNRERNPHRPVRKAP
jgi:hypothetical protein